MTKLIETFPDQVARLFPEEVKDKHKGVAIQNITLCVTSDCQLRCTYCYEKHKGTQYMTFDTAKKYIDMILTGSKGMDKYVNTEKSIGCILDFIGGEPMLAVDLIDQIVEYFIDKMIELNHPWLYRWRLSISSNGVNYFEKKTQDFLRKYKNVLSYSISIDGNKQLHDSCRLFKDTKKGSYDIAHAAAIDWMHRGNNIGSKMTYAPENLPYMYDAMIQMLDDGYKEIASNPAFEPEYTIEDGKLYYEQGKKIADEILRRNLDVINDYAIAIFNDKQFAPMSEGENLNWCGGTGKMISCDFDGKIYPCTRYMSMCLGCDQPPLIIGDVDNGMLSTPEQQKIIEDLEKITRRSQSTDECFYCSIASGCAWCSAWNYQLYGTANKRCTNICIMHKARALFNYYFWNKYYKMHNINKRMRIYIPKEWALKIISEEEWNTLKELEKVN